jgi:hypothetical protein
VPVMNEASYVHLMGLGEDPVACMVVAVDNSKEAKRNC